jgi:hypothetical protein
MTRNLLAPLIVAMAFAFGVAAPARAGVIYSSFGPGMSYLPNNIQPVFGPTSPNPKAFGVQFTAASTGRIASFDLALTPAISGTLTIQILGNVGNAPNFAAVLDSVTLDLISGVPAAIYNVASTTGAKLTAGVPYWIVTAMSGSSFAGWNVASPSIPTLGWSNNTGTLAGGSINIFESTAFAINAAAVAAPEPGSLALAASGALGLAFAARARRRR